MQIHGLLQYTSLVTRIAERIGALDGQDVFCISTPCIIIDEQYLLQGHTLKYNKARHLVSGTNTRVPKEEGLMVVIR